MKASRTAKPHSQVRFFRRYRVESDNAVEISERGERKGYYIAARRNEVSLRVFLTSEGNFVSPSDHVIFLLYKIIIKHNDVFSDFPKISDNLSKICED